MRISILLPVYNTAAYLPDCFRSIRQQSETDWELIAVDDGSTDGSLEVLQSAAAEESRILVLQNEKKGIAPALRLAFGKCSGTLVTRMDSDDLMFPSKLEQLKNALLRSGPGSVATGLVEYFSENGVGEGYRRYADWLNGLTTAGRNFEEIYRECTIPSPCWMAYRDDLRRCGAFETDVYPEDYDLCFRLRQTGLLVAPVPETLHRWRDRPDRASRTDPNYRDNTFLRLKLDWFLRSDRDTARPLVLWGAGKKGKRLARMLNEQGVIFGWVTNNADKIGHEIRGVEMRPIEVLAQLKNPQVIVAVAAPDDQLEILSFFEKNGLKQGRNFFFFC